MSNYTVKKGLAGVEDLNVGIGTYEQQRRDGNALTTKTLKKINATEIGGAYSVDTASSLIAIDESLLGDSKRATIDGLSSQGDGKGGTLFYDSTKDKAIADGKYVFDPSVSLANQGTGVGLGCWVIRLEGKVVPLDTISDLLAPNSELIAQGVSVSVSGYSTKNDGGGGLFNWDATADKATANAGTIIDPDKSLALQGTGTGSGCWVRQYSGAVNVKWFGADKTGLLASNENIQNALDYASTVVKNTQVTSVDITTAAVYIPSGSYLLEAAINVPSGVELVGDGMANTTLLVATDINAIQINSSFDVATSTGDYFYGTKIKDIAIIHTSTGSTKSGILGRGLIRSCSTEGVMIDNFKVGLNFSHCWTHIVDGCQIQPDQTPGSNSIGIYWEGATNAKIKNCRIDAADTHGIHIYNTNIQTENLTITGTASQFNQLSGIFLDAIKSASVDSCFLEGNAKAGTTWAYLHIESDGSGSFRTSSNYINKGGTGGGGKAGFYVNATKTYNSSQDIVQSLDNGLYVGGSCETANITGAVYAITTTEVINDNTDGFINYQRGFKPMIVLGRDFNTSNPLSEASLVVGKWNAGNIQYVSVGVDAGKPTIQAGGSGTSNHMYISPLGITKVHGLATLLTATSSNLNITTNISTALIDCSGGNVTVQLPDNTTPDGGFPGRRIVVKKSSNDTNNLTIATLGTGLIDGAASVVLNTAYSYLEVQTDGTDWFVIAQG